MAERPRIPEPMTPERADQIGDRWRAAGFAAIAGGALLAAAGVPDALLIATLALALCLAEQCDYYGWRRGYLAREREELRAKAGESR